VVINAGNLADAMRASMAVPGIFAPVHLNDRLLVDGGVVANVPVETARAAGADRFIVVDVGAPLRKQPEIRSALDVTDQLLRLLTRNNVKEQLKTLTGRDVYIRPELGDISSLNFDRVQSAISAGKAAAMDSADELRPFSISPKTYAAYRRKRREKRRHAPVTVDAIRILNDSRISDAVLEHRIQTQIGETLDMETLDSDFEAIYRLDVFESIDFSLDRKDEKTVLVIDANRKRWGPNYLQLGLRLEDDLQGENTYDINFGFSATERNSKGGVWRLEARIGENPRFFTEYFQPLGDSLRWFVNPLFEYEKRNVRLFEGADAVSEYRVTTTAAGLETGRALGTFGQIAVGVRRENGKAEIRVGDPDTDDYYFDDGSIYARFGYDEMDDIFFPRRGGMARITITGYRKQLGSAKNLETADVTGAWSKSLSDNTFLLFVETATAFESDIPIQNTHSLGGFLHLSGYRFNERFGNHLVFGELVYYRQLRHLLPIPVYLGASVEAGNVWAKADDIRPASLIPAGSLFFGTQTPLGPVYLGTGLAEGGRHSFYFFLGKALFP
jgi:NTE family protein